MPTSVTSHFTSASATQNCVQHFNAHDLYDYKHTNKQTVLQRQMVRSALKKGESNNSFTQGLPNYTALLNFFLYCIVEAITCPSLATPRNGNIMAISGAHNIIIGLGSVATYSCNLGYNLVGQTSRVCQSVYGTTGVWSGSPPVCEGIG